MLTAFVRDYKLSKTDLIDNHELILRATDSGIELEWYQVNNTKPLKYHIDVEQFASAQKTFPAPKQGAFNQSLGKRSRHIIDATGGWGADTLLMCAQGYKVTLIERNPLMALLLRDAMDRLAKTVWARSHNVSIPQVLAGDAIEILTSESIIADCVYLDPMFPSKKKKSAAVNKNMQLLQWLLAADQDADRLLQAALNNGSARVAVKRPDYAQVLLADSIQPTTQFFSKLVHYDVYIKSEVT